MRHSPLFLFGSLAAVLLCAAAPLRPALAQLPPPAAVGSARQTEGLRRASTAQAATPVPNQLGGTTKSERSVVLRFIKPSEFMAQLAPGDRADRPVIASLVPIGITSLSPDDTKNSLTITGTPEAVRQIEEIVRLLDVKPREVRLQVRILRAPIMANIAPEAELPESRVVATADAVVRNNAPLNLHAVGEGQLFRVFVTPHINGDRSITLSAELSEVSAVSLSSVSKGTHIADMNIKNARTWTRRIAGGTRTVVSSVPNEIDHAAAYYLEITPVIVTEKNP